MRSLARRLAALLPAALLGLLPSAAWAAGGSTDVTIRRLEEQTPNPPAPFIPLAQTGVDGQGWWLAAGGLALIAMALVAWRIARGRSRDAH